MSNLSLLIRPEILFCFSGVLLFASWLLKTSLGRRALLDAPIRRNALSPLALVGLLMIWQVLPMLVIESLSAVTESLPEWKAWLVLNGVSCFFSFVTILFTLGVAHLTFVRGVKGFGLGIRRIHVDLAQSAVILFTTLPLVMTAIALTTYVGQQVEGPEYQMEQHEALDVLTKYPQVYSRALVIVLAVVVAPFVEELLFRGVLQSMLRSYLDWPWLIIALCSTVFAAVHADMAHWPPLFVLSMGIGYAYEKSGSLWQAIFVHAMFNGYTVLNVAGAQFNGS